MEQTYTYYCHNCGKEEIYTYNTQKITITDTKSVFEFIDCYGNKAQAITDNAVGMECPYCQVYGFIELTIV